MEKNRRRSMFKTNDDSIINALVSVILGYDVNDKPITPQSQEVKTYLNNIKFKR
jgi:hypothetical protein